MSNVPTLTGNEVEFLAEEELLTVIPNFRMDTLTFVNHDYGPFRPNFPLKVPLWLAIQLRTAGKCTVVAPDWLEVQFLSARLAEEQKDEKFFMALPPHYGEVAHLILTYCTTDIPAAAQIRTLIKDITDLRQGKIRQGLRLIQAETQFIRMNKISLGELNEVRQLCLQALIEFKNLSSEPTQPGGQTQQPPTQPPTPTPAPAPRNLRQFR